MIRRNISETKPHAGYRPSMPDITCRRRYRGDDATDRLHRLTEALRQYGYDIPRTTLAGPEDIIWID